MAVKWNDNQLNAITGRGGTMLVSAAAGSGKTAVLVERVIRMLCDEKNPRNIENMLIVTFTRAAAAQMRDKIAEALRKKLAEEPGNKLLKKSIFMLPYANICTIDSFCISLVRDNYHLLDISPDFAVLDPVNEQVLKNKALAGVMARFYEERTEEFARLSDILGSSKTDEGLSKAIIEIYDFSRNYTFPESYLDKIAAQYENVDDIESTVWAKKARESGLNSARGALERVEHCLAECAEDKAYEKYAICFGEGRDYLSKLIDALENGKWDGIREICEKTVFTGRPSTTQNGPKLLGHYEAIYNSYAKGARYPAYPSFLIDFPVFKIDSATALSQINALSPCVKTLTDAVRAFSDELMDIKTAGNSYSFNDIMHFALKLLVTNENGRPVKTELAASLSEMYDEILVDEYQDVTAAQDSIFLALSKDDTNRFVVGDVKQCIYSFRQAKPEIFNALRKSMSDFDGKTYPARVTLSANYRSRRGITDTVNFIFSQMMSEEAGGVDYGESEYLYAEFPYPERDEEDVELCLIDSKKPEDQAAYVASYIENAVESGMTVYDRDGTQRAARYGDFCILLRSSTGAPKYEEVFEKNQIPLICKGSDDIFSTPEIALLVSLLRIIDNPVNDIPLTASLISPVFGFSPDELAVLRMTGGKGSIYHCLVASAEKGNKKAGDFLTRLEALRRIAVTLPAGEFTSRLVEETGLRAIVSAMKGSEERLANVNRFITLAYGYESSGSRSLSGFVRYIDNLKANKTQIESAGAKTAVSDSVILSTIHSSKGLEYPVVFVCACEATYNTTGLKGTFLVSDECGLGLRLTDNNTEYETLTRLAVAEELSMKQHSEEMRLLYVALTRAKEKLIMVNYAGTKGGTEYTYCNRLAVKGVKPDRGSVLEMNSFSNIILTGLTKHPDAHFIREKIKADDDIVEPCSSRIRFTQVHVAPAEETEEGEVPEEAPAEPGYSYDPALLEELTARLSYTYPYAQLKGLISKRIASDLGESGFDEKYFASSEPAFTRSGKLTPAQRGTATHRFMQYADFTRAAQDVSAELERLVACYNLTQAEADAVDREAVAKFFSSPLAARILSLPAEKVHREYAFNVLLPVSEFYPDVPAGLAGDEMIMVEGIADCAFEENGRLVIVDYKTDRASSPGELAEHYRPQLETYRKCLSKALGMEVAETLIYSFRFGEEIKV